MTILKEIHAWSKDLADWKQDAIARLYTNRTLAASDLDDLYALAKAEAGIPDPEGRAPEKLQDAESPHHRIRQGSFSLPVLKIWPTSTPWRKGGSFPSLRQA